MTRFTAIALTLGMLGLVASAADVFAQSAPKVFVSPSKGQSQDQQNKDTADCQQLATQQAPPSQTSGGHARGAAGGAARGAAAGAAVGAIAGDAGTGAGAGAAVGAVGGRRRSKREQQAAQAGAQNDWARAFASCMESRGYSVK